MTTKIRKWGNSYAVRIPKEHIHLLGLKDGSAVHVSLKPVRHKPTLRELVAKITPENRYPETDWGKPVGNEVW